MSKFIRATLESNSEVITINADQIVFMDKGKYGETKLNMIGGQSFTILESKDHIEAQLLRDEFAKASMQAIQSAIIFTESNNRYDQAAYNGCIAKHAYEMADAMLKERSK